MWQPRIHNSWTEGPPVAAQQFLCAVNARLKQVSDDTARDLEDSKFFSLVSLCENRLRKLLHALGIEELDASTPIATLGLTSLQVRSPRACSCACSIHLQRRVKAWAESIPVLEFRLAICETPGTGHGLYQHDEYLHLRISEFPGAGEQRPPCRHAEGSGAVILACAKTSFKSPGARGELWGSAIDTELACRICKARFARKKKVY